MSSQAQAVPGTSVPSGSLVSPGGGQGTGGPAGATGQASTVASAAFTVPAFGQTVVVTVADASWIVAGSYVWVDQAGGGVGLGANMQVTAVSGNQITLLSVNPPGIPLADNTQSGLLRQVSGNTGDFVDGTNHSQNLMTAAISTDVGNIAGKGSDNKIYVPSPTLGGILRYVSTTQLSFTPFRGGYIQINGLLYPIPAGGIAGLTNTNCFVNGVAGQNLAGSTVYRVYCFNNAGTLTADFSTTAHATSTTPGNVGVEIKSGDDTRTLIGIILTGGTPTFFDQQRYRYTRSWFNRKPISLYYSGTGTFASTTAVALVVSFTFVNFSDETLFVNTNGFTMNSTAGHVYLQHYLNGGAQPGYGGGVYAANAGSFYVVGHDTSVFDLTTEVQQNLQLYGYNVSGTATYYLNLNGLLA